MRISTMIATKDHFLFIIKNSEINDELYAAEGYPEGNVDGVVEGEEEGICVVGDTLDLLHSYQE